MKTTSIEFLVPSWNEEKTFILNWFWMKFPWNLKMIKAAYFWSSSEYKANFKSFLSEKPTSLNFLIPWFSIMRWKFGSQYQKRVGSSIKLRWTQSELQFTRMSSMQCSVEFFKRSDIDIWQECWRDHGDCPNFWISS